MNIEILILSIIQGVAEILPISSSVNLQFFSSLFNLKSFSFLLKIALHAGSLITILFYFRTEITNILKGFFSKKIKLKDTYFFPLVIGTIPVVILGYLSRDFVKEFDSNIIMGVASVFFGILLLMFDKMACAKTRTDKSPVSISKAFFIGCFQAIAIFPGVSRLGICITSSRMLSLDRKKAIFFSLLLAIPSILGSLTLEIIESIKSEQNFVASNDILIGVALTTLIGIAIIGPAIKFMEKKGFVALTIYRIIVGLAICFI